MFSFAQVVLIKAFFFRSSCAYFLICNKASGLILQTRYFRMALKCRFGAIFTGAAETKSRARDISFRLLHYVLHNKCYQQVVWFTIMAEGKICPDSCALLANRHLFSYHYPCTYFLGNDLCQKNIHNGCTLYTVLSIFATVSHKRILSGY